MRFSISFHSIFVDLACPILVRVMVQFDILVMPSKQISEERAIPNFQPPHDLSRFCSVCSALRQGFVRAPDICLFHSLIRVEMAILDDIVVHVAINDTCCVERDISAVDPESTLEPTAQPRDPSAKPNENKTAEKVTRIMAKKQISLLKD